MERARFDPMALVYHELRAPLGLVATAARSVAEDLPDEELRSRCEMIVRAAERMLRTAEAVTRATAGVPDAAHEGAGSFVPHDVVRDLVETLRGLDVPVELSLDSSAPVVVPGSQDRFEALIHSLVNNAIDHGCRDSAVRVAVEGGVRSVTVEVRNEMSEDDTHRGGGIGMIIATALARGLDANLTTETAGADYVARVTLPIRQGRRPYNPVSSRASA